MRAFLIAAITVLTFVVVGFANHAAAGEKEVCLKVDGEKIEIQNLGNEPVVIDRDGIPDFVPTSMVGSVSTAAEPKAYNIMLTGVKRDDTKAITQFDVKIDEMAYSYPKDSCPN